MNSRALIMASACVVAVLAGVAALALSRLPAGTQLPIHWNAAGEANGFASASRALFLPALIAFVVSAVLAIIPRIEPLQDRMRDSWPLLSTAWIGLLALMVLVEVKVVAPAFGWRVSPLLTLFGTGLLLVLIGNVLPKSRPGYFVGIRTPWTLTDPDNWIATHRLGSRTMMAGGLVILIAACVPITPHLRSTLVMTGIAIAVGPPVVFSWWYWRRHGRRA